MSVYEPASFVHNLYVEPEVQGAGIGKALLARALALTGGKASLECQSRNPQALAFYRHLGWTPGEEGETGARPVGTHAQPLSREDGVTLNSRRQLGTNLSAGGRMSEKLGRLTVGGTAMIPNSRQESRQKSLLSGRVVFDDQ